MRKANELRLNECECTTIMFERFKVLEAFLDDFSFLVFGRDNIVCGKYVFSLQTILNSSQATLGSVRECCEHFCLADAYTLLRKYRDDLFFCLYIVLYDASVKRGIDKSTKTMEDNIEKWCKNLLNDLNINEVLLTIGSSENLKAAVTKYKLKESFDKIGTHLNNYTHGNGYAFYNKYINLFDRAQIEKQLDDITITANYITTTFLFLLALCSPQIIMSTDYIDHLELGQVPSEGSQYWVAPFITDFFKSNLTMIDENCYDYLRDNTCMEL